jgi:hypothetical protein
LRAIAHKAGTTKGAASPTKRDRHHKQLLD